MILILINTKLISGFIKIYENNLLKLHSQKTDLYKNNIYRKFMPGISKTKKWYKKVVLKELMMVTETNKAVNFLEDKFIVMKLMKKVKFQKTVTSIYQVNYWKHNNMMSLVMISQREDNKQLKLDLMITTKVLGLQ